MEITTIEGLSADDMLHPLQLEFMEQDGFQCGYCTPGQICSAVGMIREFLAKSPRGLLASVDATENSTVELMIRPACTGRL
jgi:xanthine dehydrogenase YagT iron-sulfur-binding subunit